MLKYKLSVGRKCQGFRKIYEAGELKSLKSDIVHMWLHCHPLVIGCRWKFVLLFCGMSHICSTIQQCKSHPRQHGRYRCKTNIADKPCKSQSTQKRDQNIFQPSFSSLEVRIAKIFILNYLAQAKQQNPALQRLVHSFRLVHAKCDLTKMTVSSSPASSQEFT